MALVSTQEILEDAAARGAGVGAVDVVTLEHAEAVVAGAEQAGVPVVLQVSEAAISFHRGLAPLGAACAVLATAAAVPVSLHLDRVHDVRLLRAAGVEGMSSIMVDVAADAAGAAREVVVWAREHGLSVHAVAPSAGSGPAAAPRTDPAAAVDFVATTGVDALLVAAPGTGPDPARVAAVDLDLITALRQAVPVPLVLQAPPNATEDDLHSAVLAGAVAVDAGTLLDGVWTGALRAALADPAVVDPRSYLGPARDALTAAVSRVLLALPRGAAVTEATTDDVVPPPPAPPAMPTLY